MKDIKLLDCTLRDGGYYNKWDFSDELVKDYLDCMKSCSIDYVELGFRTLSTKGFKGPLAHTSNEYIDEKIKFSKPKIGIMLNAADLIEGNKVSWKNIEKLLSKNQKQKKIKLVRIACHYDEILKIVKICDYFKERKFKLGFNLMQISEIENSKIEQISKILNQNKLDVFYIADSLGSLDGNKLIDIINSIRSEWNGEIGLHAHDNMENALSNTLLGIKNGVTWIDSTITGMGRGPGNVKTELALLALSKFRKNKFDIKKLVDLIQNHFLDLKNKYKWGTNPFYYYAATKKIHPTFIQHLLNENYKSDEIISKINILSLQNSKKYSPALLNYKIKNQNNNYYGNWEPKKNLKKKEILILGNGPGVKKYKKAIEKYILNNRPFVLALNIEKCINEKLINARVACHPVRILSDHLDYKKFKQFFILPLANQNNDILKSLKNLKIKNFGFLIKGEKFVYKSNYAISPSNLVIAYAISICNSGNAKKIYLAGFDGYIDDEAKNKAMSNILKSYYKNDSSIKLISLTPTKYTIDTVSYLFA